jgi:hypothetical protein
MMFIDPHAHMISRTTDDYEAMAAAGVVAVIEPAFWLGQPRTNAGSYLDYLSSIVGFERFRASQFGIRHYCTIGLNSKEANNEALAEAVMELIPRFALKEGVVAIGEIGYDEQTALDIRKTAKDITIPLPDQRVWNDDNRPSAYSALALNGKRGNAREGLANPCVKSIQATVVMHKPAHNGALMRLECNVPAPAGNLDRRGVKRGYNEVTGHRGIGRFDGVDPLLFTARPGAEVRDLGAGVEESRPLERFFGALLLALVIDEPGVRRAKQRHVHAEPTKEHRRLGLLADLRLQIGVGRANQREQIVLSGQLAHLLLQHIAHPRSNEPQRHPGQPRVWIDVGEVREAHDRPQTRHLAGGDRIGAKGDGPRIALSDEAGVVGVFVHPDRRRREVLGEACADQLCLQRRRVGIGEAELGPKLTQGKLGERAALTLQPGGGIDDESPCPSSAARRGASAPALRRSCRRSARSR